MSTTFPYRPPLKGAPQPVMNVTPKPQPPPPTHHAYKEIPALAQWVTDSPLDTTPRPTREQERKRDPALKVVDERVNVLESAKTHGERCFRLAELFFATMWWMNHHKECAGYVPGSDATRRTAMLSLNLCAANKLATTLNCSNVNELAGTLHRIYGVEMTQHGKDTDRGGQGGYLNVAERETRRVIFRAGKAYRFPSKAESAKPIGEAKLVPWHTGVPSEESTDTSGRFGCLFVMSMSGDLFAGYEGSRALTVTYHSSFLAGGPVLCAGTMCFDQGRIVYICNDSGHYGPTDTAMVKVLQRLRLAGVDLKNITVVDRAEMVEWKGKIRFSSDIFDEHPEMKPKGSSPSPFQHTPKYSRTMRGDLFLYANGNWETIGRSSGHHGDSAGIGMHVVKKDMIFKHD